MLEQLFGSKARVKILRLILLNSGDTYCAGQISEKIGIQTNTVRDELSKLSRLGIFKLTDQGSVSHRLSKTPREKKQKIEKSKAKKFYQADSKFILFPELRSLLLKSQFILEKSFVKKIEEVGTIRFLVLTGFFIGMENSLTDLLIVGKINKEKLRAIISQFERDLCHEINYTVFTVKEYSYRKDITDRFLYGILENKHVKVIDDI